MDINIKSSLERLKYTYLVFEHKGKSMTKDQVRSVLQYGVSKDYKYLSEISDEEVKQILENQNQEK